MEKVLALSLEESNFTTPPPPPPPGASVREINRLLILLFLLSSLSQLSYLSVCVQRATLKDNRPYTSTLHYMPQVFTSTSPCHVRHLWHVYGRRRRKEESPRVRKTAIKQDGQTKLLQFKNFSSTDILMLPLRCFPSTLILPKSTLASSRICRRKHSGTTTSLELRHWGKMSALNHCAKMWHRGLSRWGLQAAV